MYPCHSMVRSTTMQTGVLFTVVTHGCICREEISIGACRRKEKSEGTKLVLILPGKMSWFILVMARYMSFSNRFGRAVMFSHRPLVQAHFRQTVFASWKFFAVFGYRNNWFRSLNCFSIYFCRVFWFPIQDLKVVQWISTGSLGFRLCSSDKNWFSEFIQIAYLSYFNG